MTHMTVRPGKWRAAGCAALFSAAALLCAAPASADATDDTVLAALSNYGITVDDPGATIARAHAVCAALDRNPSSSVLAMRLMRETNFSPRQAGYFIGLSIAAYCPEHRGATDPSVIWLLPHFPTTQ